MDDELFRIRDRATGATFTERMIGAATMRFFYGNLLGRAFTDWVLSRELLNHFYGLWQRSSLSRGAIRGYIDGLGIDPTEAEHPLEHYATLDAFFTRRFKPGARPFDPLPGHLPTPAEGRILVYPRVEGTIRVKGADLSVPDLLGDAAPAARFRGGDVVVVRLAPADYHRFHFPDDGYATESHRIGSGLHSVHPIALAAGAQAFCNKRTVCRLASRNFGELVLIEVGALIVGSIVQTYTPGPVARGQEKGCFRFGGSTVVLVTEPNRLIFDDDLVAASAEDVETLTKVGTRIARAR